MRECLVGPEASIAEVGRLAVDCDDTEIGVVRVKGRLIPGTTCARTGRAGSVRAASIPG